MRQTVGPAPTGTIAALRRDSHRDNGRVEYARGVADSAADIADFRDRAPEGGWRQYATRRGQADWNEEIESFTCVRRQRGAAAAACTSLPNAAYSHVAVSAATWLRWLFRVAKHGFTKDELILGARSPGRAARSALGDSHRRRIQPTCRPPPNSRAGHARCGGTRLVAIKGRVHRLDVRDRGRVAARPGRGACTGARRAGHNDRADCKPTHGRSSDSSPGPRKKSARALPVQCDARSRVLWSAPRCI